MDPLIESKFKKFLNLFWLRPEQALMTTFKSESFKELKFKSPSLDLSCGDGLFMFLHLGGVFEEDFDYFLSTKADKFSHSSVIDIYDHFEDDYQVRIIERPTIQIDYGTDLKDGLLRKAAKTNLYKNLLQHDNNNLPLPFMDNYFKTIYSNSVYFARDQEGLLSDIYRILKPGGTAVLAVVTPYLHETFEQLKHHISKEALAILEREERTLMPGMRVYDEWKKNMLNTGFKIQDAKSVYPNKLLIDMYNVGLRPISHLLIQMANSIDEKDRYRIKQEWVEIFYKLLKSFLYIPKTYSLEGAPYISFVLKK